MGEPAEIKEPSESMPAVPADKSIIPNHLVGDGQHIVTLRRLPLMEAEMAKAKLEAEGISSFVADSNMTVIHPLMFPYVTLQVSQIDLPLAEEILSRPAADGADGEYADEEYRCPKCHHRMVDLLPLSARMKRVRSSFLLLIVIQIVVRIIYANLPDGNVSQIVESVLMWLLLPWLIAVFVLGLWWFLSKRSKRCRECGHEWGNEAA